VAADLSKGKASGFQAGVHPDTRTVVAAGILACRKGRASQPPGKNGVYSNPDASLAIHADCRRAGSTGSTAAKDGRRYGAGIKMHSSGSFEVN
jgi:hypothetical protein